MRMTIGELTDGLGAIPRGDRSTEFDGASIDSREIRDGQLFVAIRAERDGHEFVASALQHGAAAALVDQPVDVDLPQVIVADTEVALTRIGAMARDRLDPMANVVAITGSVGKTSTKDMLAAVLGSKMIVGASARSFNNELGVPITLVEAPEGASALVVEMGARGIGHIADLCALARPDIGIVTRVAAAHTEMFGTVEEVGRAKGELVEALPETGSAVLNGDDPLVSAMAGRTSATVLTYGLVGAPDVKATDVEVDGSLRPSFTLHSPWGDAQVQLAIAGRHNVGNALAAASAALAIGLSPGDVAEGLAEASVSQWRMDLSTAPSGALVLNDAYNANPTSMAAALKSLAELPVRRRVAVLGPMAELGDDSRSMHLDVVALADSLGVEVMVVGTEEYGVLPVSLDGAAGALSSIDDDVAVLVKGSRVAGLERLATLLLTESP